MPDDTNIFDKLKEKAGRTIEGLRNQYNIGGDGSNSWPQTKYDPISGVSGSYLLNPHHKTKGFLPPQRIEPTIKEDEDVIKNYGEYNYKDWRGHRISLDGDILTTKDRFEESKSIPKTDKDLDKSPYSTRDHYQIFNDNSTDYFKHGLHIMDNLTPIENPISGKSNLRSQEFTQTPFENNDPIIYGFDIIIDDINSPLLNGSIEDFINNYSNISEVAVRKDIYEDFKRQFVKFFKTKTEVDIDDTENSISELRDLAYSSISKDKDIFQSSKRAYLNYYLKKIDGLSKLVDRNTPSEKKYLSDYNNDIISLSLSEDVSMSMGTLAHLYKLLYWSKPNGKGIIPENLLRFNCDIIVSEVRNFNRVRKAVEDNNIEVVKDNVSRQIYSLKECQFYFNNTTHGDSIDMNGVTVKEEGSYVVQFDYKFSTSKLERFVPNNTNFGEYLGYDNGAIWKVGNNKGNGTRSVPSFFTKGNNEFNDNGLSDEIKIKRFGILEDEIDNNPIISGEKEEEDLSTLERLKRGALSKAREAKDRLEDVAISSASRELQTYVNTRTAILNKTLNKILNSSGVTGVRPPKNIYTDDPLNPGQRIFYDVRGDLINFAGNSIGDALGGGGFTGGSLLPR